MSKQSNMKKTKVKLLLLLVAFTLASGSSVFAQGPDAPPFEDPEGPEPPPAPIDQSLSVLVILGIGFAYKALAKSN